MRITLLLLAFAIVSCKQHPKYEIATMLGNDYLDVTDYIVKEKYQPLYCDSTLVGLLKPANSRSDSALLKTVTPPIMEWLAKNQPTIYQAASNNKDLVAPPKYQYSYFIMDDLVDVYATHITIGTGTFKVFYRIDKQQLMLPFDEKGWVQCSSWKD